MQEAQPSGAKGIHKMGLWLNGQASQFSVPRICSFTLSSPFIQDHDHCWKLGAVE
jgi:hypothetical protein